MRLEDTAEFFPSVLLCELNWAGREITSKMSSTCGQMNRSSIKALIGTGHRNERGSIRVFGEVEGPGHMGKDLGGSHGGDQ